MLRLAVCDDDPRIRDQLRSFFLRLETTSKLALNVICFQSSIDILSANLEGVDVCILDIELGDGSGLDVARSLRKRYGDLEIIFITNYAQYAIEGYRVHAFDFIKKPFTFDRLQETLLPCLCRIEREKTVCVNVKNDAGMFQIPQRQIVYIETYRRHLLLHVRDKPSIESYSSMAALEPQLEENAFFRCHTSYIVNLEYIAEILPSELVLKDQTRLAVSKHRRRELMVRIANFWGDRFL